jgi:dihydrofolate reductase
MRKLIVSESLTLDGVYEGLAKTSNETFKYAGWAEPYASQEQMEYVSKNTSGGGVLLFGRLTYDHMKAGWESQTGPVADYMNNVTKYVVSSTMKKADWNNSHLIKGDVVEEVKKLKKESDQDIAILGSGQLARAMMDADLIDSYMFLVYPLVLGTGKRFFGDTHQAPLKLTDSKGFSTGVMMLNYEPDRKK